MAAPPSPPLDAQRGSWHVLLGIAPPALLLALLIGALAYALYARVELSQEAERDTLREWLDEARVHRRTLPELVRDYLDLLGPEPAHPVSDPAALRLRAEELQAHLAALGNPTKMLPEQLPLFPVIYELRLDLPDRSVVWDSELPRPRPAQQVGELAYFLLGPNDDRAVVHVQYQLHAYNKRQEEEEARQRVLRWLVGIAIAAVALSTLWAWFYLRRERERELRALVSQHQIEHAERLLLENELRQQDAERKNQEMERKLLEQKLATQAVEQRALEIKSQLFASIGIMAGSYAHNIKNLLVRPNDLVRRCLETDGLQANQRRMMQEVNQSLQTVTERLQLILKTVSRDPTRSSPSRLDLNELVRDVVQGWQELAQQKWKLKLHLELAPKPLWIMGDPSHLTQTIENLLFNARDATFEMRNKLREDALQSINSTEDQRKRGLIAAAAWLGWVVLRTRAAGPEVVLEVQDNGIGMTDEVRLRCTETHFTTKRSNALYQGLSTGMGLGLAFVQAVLEGHRGRLEIVSTPLQGATFRIFLPADVEAKPDPLTQEPTAR